MNNYGNEFDNIIKEVCTWLDSEDKSTQNEFLSCEFSDLVSYHHSLGRNIRNEFKLWKRKFKPEIVNGVDNSPYHPDAISMYIIQEVWKIGNTNARNTPQ